MRKLLILLAGLAALAAACKKDTQSSTPATTGTAYGYITLRDEFGNLINPSGVAVSATGSSGVTNTTTDTLGRYTMANMAGGAYNISFTKTNISNYKTFGRDIIAGSSLNYLGNQALYLNSTAVIDTLNIDTLNTNIHISGAVTNANVANLATFGKINSTQVLHLFFSKNPAVSSQTYTYTYLYTIVYNKNTRIPLNNTISASGLYLLGFHTGDKVYWVGYMGGTNSSYGYTDCTNNNLYPCVTTYCGLSQPSQVSSFIMP